VAPPLASVTTDLLEQATRRAATTVSVPCPPLNDGQGVTLIARWGEQLDVHRIPATSATKGASAEQITSYHIYTASAILSFLSFFFVVQFVSETKGKELEEMRV
jgi:hypothetical protein